MGEGGSAAELRRFGFDVPSRFAADDWVFLGFNHQTMGDTNACAHAQQAHETMLRRGGALSSRTTLRYGRPLPRGKLWQGAFSDDYGVGVVLPRSAVSRPGGGGADLLKVR